MTTVVEVTDVSRRFGSAVALDGVSFSLQRNTIYGLLGRNGAGKTTLRQILTGQQFTTAGAGRRRPAVGRRGGKTAAPAAPGGVAGAGGGFGGQWE